jgi:hypothetical protein
LGIRVKVFALRSATLSLSYHHASHIRHTESSSNREIEALISIDGTQKFLRHRKSERRSNTVDGYPERDMFAALASSWSGRRKTDS